jgi:hypothetical protein
MFSNDDLDKFVIELELPHVEEKKNAVDEFIAKYPLSTLKFDVLQTLMVKLRETIGQLPSMSLEGKGVSLNVTKRSLRLEIEKAKSIGLTSEKKGIEDIQPFSEDSLRRISNDFNFVLAGVMGLLGLKSVNAETHLIISKDIDKDLCFDRFLTPEFWNKLGESKEKHVSGFQIDSVGECIGTSANCRMRVSSNVKEQEEPPKKKEITVTEQLWFDLKGPLDLCAMIKERLEKMSSIYNNLTGAT